MNTEVGKRQWASTSRVLRFAFSFAVGLLAVSALAARNTPTFLDPEVAFKMVPEVLGEKTIGFTFSVAPGYYLYRDRFAATSADAALGPLDVPPGQVRFDETFGKDVETHQGRLTVRLPVQTAGRTARVVLTYPGVRGTGPVLSTDPGRTRSEPARLRRLGAREGAGRAAR